ncbi:MAG: hypothetical protein IJ654_05300 [Bacteroidales bacterium]|nr:hypothetical protein [Bacteroidales bacterium]
MSDRVQLAALALGLAAVFALGFALGRGRKPAPQTVTEIRTDTVTVRDTITVSTPVYIVKTAVRRDTVTACDTVRLRDTLRVVLNREQVEWRDSLCTVWASGVRPSVDSVRHYTRTEIVTQTVKVPGPRNVTRWGVGVQAGYGVSDKGLTPYIGVGLSYNLLAW